MIDSKEKLESFKAEDEKDINKVILFSKKSKVPPIYKVLTNDFRDTIRFGFISSDKEDLVKQFDIDNFPTVLVFKTYDTDTKLILEQEEVITYKKEGFKLDELKKFIRPLTRDDIKEAK